MKSFYGESWHFGISTSAPAGQQVLDFLEDRGLEVESFESLGPTLDLAGLEALVVGLDLDTDVARESGRTTPIGGLIVAAV